MLGSTLYFQFIDNDTHHYFLMPGVLWLILGAGILVILIAFICTKKGGEATIHNIIFSFLFTDIIFITLIIEFTGAITNPFTSSLLVPVALGIALLPKIYSALLILISGFVYGFWLINNDHHSMMHHDFGMHLYGMGLNFLLSVILLFIFISIAISTIKSREQQLSRFREKSMSDEQLVGIVSLTANTAHALGTSLQTLTLITDDLQENTRLSPRQLKTMKGQINACKEYLHQLSKTVDIAKHSSLDKIKLHNLIAKLNSHYSLQPHFKELIFNTDNIDADSSIPYGPSLFFALINLVENAIKASNNIVISIF